MSRLAMVKNRGYSSWIDANLAALAAPDLPLLPQNRRLLEGFARARHGPLPERLWALRRLGLYRQSRSGDLALMLAGLGRSI